MVYNMKGLSTPIFLFLYLMIGMPLSFDKGSYIIFFTSNLRNTKTKRGRRLIDYEGEAYIF